MHDIFTGDEDFDENEEQLDKAVEAMRGTINKGDCCWCHESNSMRYNPLGYFLCKKCNMMVDEDIYYRWKLGAEVEYTEWDDIVKKL